MDVSDSDTTEVLMSCPIQGGDGRARWPALRQAEIDARAVAVQLYAVADFRRRRPDQGYGRVVLAQVTSLTLRRIGALPLDTRPAITPPVGSTRTA